MLTAYTFKSLDRHYRAKQKGLHMAHDGKTENNTTIIIHHDANEMLLFYD
jgi:hypothetical protein